MSDFIRKKSFPMFVTSQKRMNMMKGDVKPEEIEIFEVVDG